jgi:hypothetical protein
MADGVLIVESRPASPEDEAAFHQWYDDVHLPEMLKIEGFASARRLRAADGDSWVAIYDIEGDVDAAKAALKAAQGAGALSAPVGVQLSPPPTVRYFVG